MSPLKNWALLNTDSNIKEELQFHQGLKYCKQIKEEIAINHLQTKIVAICKTLNLEQGLRTCSRVPWKFKQWVPNLGILLSIYLKFLKWTILLVQRYSNKDLRIKTSKSVQLLTLHRFGNKQWKKTVSWSFTSQSNPTEQSLDQSKPPELLHSHIIRSHGLRPNRNTTPESSFWTSLPQRISATKGTAKWAWRNLVLRSCQAWKQRREWITLKINLSTSTLISSNLLQNSICKGLSYKRSTETPRGCLTWPCRSAMDPRSPVEAERKEWRSAAKMSKYTLRNW